MIHLIYRVPPSSNKFIQNLESWQWKIIRKLKYPIPTSWRRGGSFAYEESLRAPYSITVNLYKFLSRRTNTYLYDLFEPSSLRYRKNDIILGHPWMEPNSIAYQALFNPAPCRLKALIFPIHHGIPEINYYALPFVERADIVFGIMGPYWYDTIELSEFASWKPKLVRLDMAIDSHAFPLVKTHFNPPGRRGYLYIGRNSPEKGPDVLSQTMAGLLDYPRGWIGSGEEIANIERETIFTSLTPDYIRSLGSKYDFFVNTSVSDANPTTILEAMSWGFPVACTPQSGYYKTPSIIELSTTDIASNIQKLQELQYCSEENLKEVSRNNRTTVEKNYTWERFCSIVWEKIGSHL